MITRTIKYKDFDGEEKEKVLYFHLTKLELTRLDAKLPGGLESYAKAIAEAQTPAKLLELIEDVILTAYGVKTPEGKFIKSLEARRDFEYSECYSELIMNLLNSPQAMEEFVSGLAYVEDNKELEVIEGGKKNKK
jgi:hypothetical protein|nr:MAG TPA: hypothetical protein [Caudoviricetes sp.]